MKTYVCRKIRLYQFLTDNGFVPYKTCADKFDCTRLVWLYEDSSMLRECVEKYYSMKH